MFFSSLITSTNDSRGLELQMRARVTHIIHTAWPVNFKYAFGLFESAISFVRELAGLAISSTRKRLPTISFMSTVATLLRAPVPDWVEEAPIEGLEVAVGTGYGQAKRVAEEVCQCQSVASQWYPLTMGGVRGLTDSQRRC
jgi:thioester reductase-like protein